MKYLKFSFLFIALAIVGVSCEDEVLTTANGDYFATKGALPTVSNIVTGFFNLADPSNASVGFDLGAVGESTSGIDVYKAYNGGTRVLHTASSAGTSLTVTLAEALSGLGVTVGDLSPGDVIAFTFDGKTAAQTYKSGTILNVPVSCPSDLSGAYSVTTTGTSTDGCCPGEVTVMTMITLTETGGGGYGISDWSGGLYFEWYDIYGIQPDSNTGDILDVCNDVALTTSSEPFGETLTGSGSVDPSTGVVSFSWLTGYGDQGVSTWTPN